MDERFSEQIFEQLKRIAEALEKIARGSEPEEPNLVRPIEDYRGFDWASIGASIVRQDADGPTHLEHNGFLWLRRSPQNKFDGAIWYSRPAGKDADGNIRYLRLISFREIKDVDPLPAKLAKNLAPASALAAEPVKPAASGESKAGTGNGKVSWEDYFREATSRKFNLSGQAVEAIAKLAGVAGDGMEPTADYAQAMKYVPYFAECKALGMKYPEARDILQKHQGSVDQALFEVRDSRKEAKR